MAKVAKRKPARAKREPRKLTPKQGAFALEYLIDHNATKAAMRAGFSEKTASQQGWQLLQNPLVRAEIGRLEKEQADRLKMDADQLLRRLIMEADADLADLFDEAGSLKSIHEWPVIWRKGLVAGIEVEEEYDDEDDAPEFEMEPQGHGGALKRNLKRKVAVGRVCKVKLSDRTKRIDLIGRHQAVQAWKDRKVLDVADPIKQLFEQIAGKAIGPGGRG